MNLDELWQYDSKSIHPGFSVDCVIIGFHNGNLKVLLNKFNLGNYWALPGGFMLNDEDADQAAHRILKSRTGLKNIFLKQFHLFSDPQRTIMKQNIDFIKQNTQIKDGGKWLLRRFITLGYYAFVKYEDVTLSFVDGETSKWYNIKELPDLYSDHRNIVRTALKTIRSRLPIIPLGDLLPERFTMTELRKIHEIILGKSLDRRNFQRKMLSEGYIVQLEERKNTQAYNAPILYSFSSKDEE